MAQYTPPLPKNPGPGLVGGIAFGVPVQAKPIVVNFPTGIHTLYSQLVRFVRA